jgi:hypothetical protein
MLDRSFTSPRENGTAFHDTGTGRPFTRGAGTADAAPAGPEPGTTRAEPAATAPH